jgi:predicted Holliday junction resolvase-like endonuclease
MVSFNQHIIFPAGSQIYMVILILVLTLLVLAVWFVGVGIRQLRNAIQMQSEMLRVGDRVQARKVEGKKE